MHVLPQPPSPSPPETQIPDMIPDAGASSDDMSSVDVAAAVKPKKRRLSLAEALSTRVVVAGAARPTPTFTTTTTTPVATHWLKTASNAGTESLSESVLAADGDADAETLGARVMDPDCTIDADALCAAVGRFRKHDKTLTPLPAPWWACSVVTRCLYEVKNRRFAYLVPLVDLLALGVVSHAALQGFLSRFAVLLAADDKISTTSLAASLCHPEALHALEAALLCVPDLPETDVVRCAQYAIRLRRAAKRADDTKSTAEWRNTIHVKTHRVLMRCVVVAVDMVRLGKALNSIPMSDVKDMLNFFANVLSTMRTRDVKLCVQGDCKSPDNYVGVNRWLDDDLSESQNVCERKELEGCMEWVGIVVDSHMASILLDSHCHDIVSDLLLQTNKQRQVLETMAPLVGALEHVERKLDVPDYQEQHLFTLRRMRVNATIHP